MFTLAVPITAPVQVAENVTHDDQIGRFHPFGQLVVLYQVWSTPTVMGLLEVPCQDQVIGKLEFVHTSQPFITKVSPAAGLYDAQFDVQFAIPGKCAHGVLLFCACAEEFESEPVLLEM